MTDGVPIPKYRAVKIYRSRLVFSNTRSPPASNTVHNEIRRRNSEESPSLLTVRLSSTSPSLSLSEPSASSASTAVRNRFADCDGFIPLSVAATDGQRTRPFFECVTHNRHASGKQIHRGAQASPTVTVEQCGHTTK